MFLQRGSRALRSQWGASKVIGRVAMGKTAQSGVPRWFSESRRLYAVKPVLLADIGEGIVECEVIQWFVEPGARVEEFSPLCEVQSDKASVEITSRFTGTVKKLYYEAGEMAKVGKPFVDIDIQGGAAADTEAPPAPAPAKEQEAPATPAPTAAQSPAPAPVSTPTEPPAAAAAAAAPSRQKGKGASISTPAVRHLSKELGVDINDIDGTGKDGRVSKEDILRFVENRDAAAPGGPLGRHMMFKTMSRSLTIPHFLYADEIDFSDLVSLRSRLNKVLAKTPQNNDGQLAKLSYLPFIIKAVSLALYQFPILNARVELDPTTTNANGKPSLIMRSQHNIGVAMDAPQGLVVPVIKNVGALNIVSIAAELGRLQALAQQGKLGPADMAGGTITVSNIGNIGGTYLSPVIVEREVAILGIGRMRTVPAFDEHDNIVKKQICNFSWSADHRVVDGATMARAADVVRSVVEEPDVMVMHLR
ncbi:Lipoamide acyltransferase component of branched-cha in alpha-keto acid dehydrogenase complex [Beauveria bassiana D1-5]|uniref:Dihydrolipoamide acetyltransferase component of pyruvate dehydrogenase complex n=1 Tax=Beauveria bassiana D1-5 TaxID=1245745 RepID=A0A0A2VSN0_BEABA|nr:Lipoamide acyltransferase component of branched-cha in alpha-keto acid dehydrogenase complex [Beauveria bassiana D1-5]